MLFMLLVGASEASEAGALPDPALRDAMDRYNADLEAAGVRVMARGLHPTREAVRVTYPVHGGAPVVGEGPVGDPGQRVAGFFLLNVASEEEARGWLLRAPDPQGHGEGWIELRRVHGG